MSHAASGRFDESAFVRACRGLSVDRVPVWFMRQAGRSLPEYRSARGEGSILEAIRSPDLVAELTRQPVDRYGTDAAIFFSDIMVPAAAVGFGVDIAPGTGPVVAEPIRSRADLERLRPLDAERDTPYVVEAVEALVGELDVPLIGFAGGPFTVASYLIEGGPSKNYETVKSLMLSDPVLWFDLVERLGDLALVLPALPARRRRRRPSRCSIPGRGSSPPATTRSWCCPPPGGSSTSWPKPTPVCRACCSVSGPASCSGRWPPRGAR